MNFQTTKINNDPPKKEKNFKFKKPSQSITLIALLILIIFLLWGIVKAIKSIDFTLFLSIAGQELQVDDNNHSNFLILGTGGENHDGGDLTDTILIASLDQKSKKVTMISIPRDLYIKDTLVGSSRINEVYYNAKKYYSSQSEGILHLEEKIEELTDIQIHYHLLLDFKGFKEIIDILGGIDVYVEDDIYDPYYPKDGTYLFEPFRISQGYQHLDGETALKYARSRKTTSDFDRARRQQDIIYAIKDKALSTDIILSTEKIGEILESVKDNIETNITVKEFLTLGSIGKDFTRDSITQRLLHDDPNYCGGLLYTPAREYYNGMFVLVPAGGEEFIHRYTQLNFKYSDINPENTKLHILNGTKTGGIAGETKQILKRLCFDIIRYGNAKDQLVPETIYYYKNQYDEDGELIDTKPAALEYLQTLIPGIETTKIPEEYQEYMLAADIIIEIGEDYISSEDYIDDPYYYLVDITSPTTEETTEETTESTTNTTNEN